VITELAVGMAKDNSTWGYTRIQGALSNLGYTVGRTSIARILKEHGVDPSPKREMSWATFLRAHWDVIAAADLFTVEAWVKQTLVRYHVLFAIELATRRVQVLGIAPEPDGPWMEQVVRNATDAFPGFLTGKFHLILDRDPGYTRAVRGILQAAGIEVVRLPPRSPNLNAYAERFVRSIKGECLGRMIFFSERQVRMAVGEYMEHFHVERNHQGLGHELIDGVPEPRNLTDEIVCMPRLGGMLNHYSRAA
jgi:transposase InsO family protein